MSTTIERLQIELGLNNANIVNIVNRITTAMKNLDKSTDVAQEGVKDLGKELSSFSNKANKSFNSIQIDKLIKDLNSVKTAIQGLSSGFGKEVNSIKGHMTNLSKTITQQEQNIKNLKQQIQSIGASGGDTSVLEKQLLSEQNALTVNQSKLRNYQGQLQEIVNRQNILAKASNVVKTQIATLSNGLKTGTINSEDLSKSTKELSADMETLSTNGEGVMDGFNDSITEALTTMNVVSAELTSLSKQMGGVKFGRAKKEDIIDRDTWTEGRASSYDMAGIDYTTESLNREYEAYVRNTKAKNDNITVANKANSINSKVSTTYRQLASAIENNSKATQSNAKGQESANKSARSYKEIISDLAQKSKQLVSGSKDLTNSNKNIAKSFNNVGNSVNSLLSKLGIVVGLYQVIGVGKEMITLASDLQEVQNVVDTVFPSMTTQVENFAQSTMRSFGLSELGAKTYISNFGAMAKNFTNSEAEAYAMSETLTKLTGDLASFRNISQDSAYEKLSSIFTGETESLKSLGVVMTENALQSWMMKNGIEGTISKMSEAEKVAIRYKFVLDQLSLANGDFAKT